MRVAFTVPNFRPRITGPGLLVEEVAKRLAEKGHECLLVTRNADKAIPPRAGVTIAPLAGSGRSGYPSRRAVEQALDGFHPDLVFVHEMRNPLTVWVARWATDERVRLAIQPHGEWNAYRAMPHLWQRLPFYAYDATKARGFPPRSSTVVATSAFEEAELKDTLGEHASVTRLYLGADTHLVGPRGKTVSPRILMLANFGVFRDPWPLIDASRLLKQEGKDHELVLAGGFAPHSIFQRTIRRPGPADATYTGPVAPEARTGTLSDADLFCYPSRYESFGLPILEAAASGLPVLSSHVGIAPEILPAEWLVPADPRPPDLAKALGPRLSTLDEERRALARSARPLCDWAAWKRRAESYRAFVEGGDPLDDAPPRLTV